MKLHIQKLILIMLVCLSITSTAQTNFPWQEFLPGQPVDSILLLSTNSNQPTDMEETNPDWKEQLLKKQAVLADTTFPLHDIQSLYFAYEIRKTIHEEKNIRFLTALFPNETCENYPIFRCRPVFRDCAFFYRSGKPVFAVKICFECQSVRTTPSIENAKCLSKEKYLDPIAQALLSYGMIDLYKRE